MPPLAPSDLADQAGWRSELTPGERLVWTGRPGALALGRSAILISLFGIPFFAFACFWEAQALGIGSGRESKGVTTFMAFWGIPFILVGFGMLMASPWAVLRARWIRYAITDRRAMILTLWPIRKLQAFAAHDLNTYERRGAPDGPGDLIFQRRARAEGDGGYVSRAVGFYGIARLREAEAAITALRAKRDTVG